jgi:hypothetical protein
MQWSLEESFEKEKSNLKNISLQLISNRFNEIFCIKWKNGFYASGHEVFACRENDRDGLGAP